MLWAGLLLLTWLSIRYIIGLLHIGYMDAAIGTVRHVVNSENAFSESHPARGFTCNLSEVTGDLPIKNSRRNGYSFAISGCSPGPLPNKRYIITATPLHSDLPAYCADQSGILKTDYNSSIVNCITSGQTN